MRVGSELGRAMLRNDVNRSSDAVSAKMAFRCSFEKSCSDLVSREYCDREFSIGPQTRSNDWGSSSSNGDSRSPSSMISAFCWRGPSCRVAKDGAVDSYDMTESAELRIVVGCSFMGIREDSMFCGTALDVRDILRVRVCCMSGVTRPLLGEDGSALSRRCNDMRFLLA